MTDITHEQIIQAVKTAMQESEAWPAVFQPETADVLARAAIATIAEATKEPTEAMECAPGIDPDDCATPDAAQRIWREMHAKSPLYPEGK